MCIKMQYFFINTANYNEVGGLSVVYDGDTIISIRDILEISEIILETSEIRSVII